MNRWAAWSIGGGLVVAAWFVALATPSTEAAEAPFPVAVEVGERGVGRNIAATVTDVRLADGVAVGGWAAEGTWLVVDLEVENLRTETPLSEASFTVDAREYRASERPGAYTEALFTRQMAVGIPRAGSIAFELPTEVSGAGVLRLAVDADTRLDSIIEVPIDLDALETENDVELTEAEWAR